MERLATDMVNALAEDIFCWLLEEPTADCENLLTGRMMALSTYYDGESVRAVLDAIYVRAVQRKIEALVSAQNMREQSFSSLSLTPRARGYTRAVGILFETA